MKTKKSLTFVPVDKVPKKQWAKYRGRRRTRYNPETGTVTTTRTTRKTHYCCDCGKEITKGEEYQEVKRDFGDLISRWRSVRICEKCWKGRKM